MIIMNWRLYLYLQIFLLQLLLCSKITLSSFSYFLNFLLYIQLQLCSFFPLCSVFKIKKLFLCHRTICNMAQYISSDDEYIFFSEGQDIVIEGENPLKLTGYSSSMITCRNTAGGEQDNLKWYGANKNEVQSYYSNAL